MRFGLASCMAYLSTEPVWKAGPCEFAPDFLTPIFLADYQEIVLRPQFSLPVANFRQKKSGGPTGPPLL